MNDGRQASIEVNSSFLKFGSISIPESAGLQLLLPCNEIGQKYTTLYRLFIILSTRPSGWLSNMIDISALKVIVRRNPT